MNEIRERDAGINSYLYRPGTARVLWISRHLPQPSQVEALEKAFGIPVAIEVRSVTLSNDPREGADEVQRLIEETNADDVVGVMPVPHLAELTRRGIQPLRAVMRRTPTGQTLDNGEMEYRFDFEYFERVLKVEVVTEPLG